MFLFLIVTAFLLITITTVLASPHLHAAERFFSELWYANERVMWWWNGLGFGLLIGAWLGFTGGN